MADFFTWEDEFGSTHVIVADCVPTFNDERTAEVTKFPTEKGALITDHVIQNSDTVSFEIVQTQTPIEEGNGFEFKTKTLDVRQSLFRPGGLLLVTSAVSSLVSSLLGSESDATDVQVLVNTRGEADRVADIHDALILAKESGALCTFSILGRIYPDFVLTSVALVRSAESVGAGRFKIEASQIRTTETASVAAINPEDFRMKPSAKKGAKPSKTLADEEKKVVKRSLLKQGLSSMTDGLGL